MAFINDNKIQYYYTQKYKEKLSQKGGATPTYFSLIDSEINYNLINIDDTIVGNEGFENNSVTSDLDSKVFDIPILEPCSNTYDISSIMYGYWDLDSVESIENIGSELTDNMSEYTKFTKYIFQSTYSKIPDQTLLQANNVVNINAETYGIYKTYFELQVQNELALYTNGSTQTLTGILSQYVEGSIPNDYGLYNDRIYNKSVGRKSINEVKIREISSAFLTGTRGFYRINNEDSNYYPSHKTFLHLESNTLSKHIIIDVTGENMVYSDTFSVNPFYLQQMFENNENVSYNVTVWFESMFKSYINDQFVIFKTSAPKIYMNIVLE